MTAGTAGRIWAVVPAKGTERAKTRLGAVLGGAERRALFAAMLADVLAAARSCPAFEAVAVVTADPAIAAIAEGSGALVIPDTLSAGQSAAVGQGAAYLAQAGVPTLVTLPGDVPCVPADELATVVRAHRPGRAVTIVPSRDGRGTNCLALTPPAAIGLRFGEVSFPRHMDEAAAAGIAPVVLRLPGLGLDIDTPDDLRRLLDARAGPRTREFLATHEIARRVRREAMAERKAQREEPVEAGQQREQAAERAVLREGLAAPGVQREQIAGRGVQREETAESDAPATAGAASR